MRTKSPKTCHPHSSFIWGYGFSFTRPIQERLPLPTQHDMEHMPFPSAVSSYDELWLSLIKPIFIPLNLNFWQALSAFLFGACSSPCSTCIIYFHTLLYDNAVRESSEGSTVFFRQKVYLRRF